MKKFQTEQKMIMNRKDLVKILKHYNLENNLILAEGYYCCDVSNDIYEPEEWRTELLAELSEYDIQHKGNVSDILSLACYDNLIPSGDYLLKNFW